MPLQYPVSTSQVGWRTDKKEEVVLPKTLHPIFAAAVAVSAMLYVALMAATVPDGPFEAVILGVFLLAGMNIVLVITTYVGFIIIFIELPFVIFDKLEDRLNRRRFGEVRAFDLRKARYDRLFLWMMDHGLVGALVFPRLWGSRNL
jgi:hypothetical protein